MSPGMRLRAALPAALVLALGAVPAHAADLVLKRVLLSTGGVAYFEREAEVDGDATLSLEVPLDAVDDVLKSIVVYDDKGGVGSASLPGREPLQQIFAELPFSRDALEGPAALLNALQGAEIRVAGPTPLTGKLIKVVPETVLLANKTVLTRNRASILSSAGLQQFVLEDAQSVRFADAALQQQVEGALAALSAHRTKDRRTIELSSRGTGKRLVRIGYVAAAPLWKASYRVSLPQDPSAATAQLQGWAVLENMSGQEWSDVELTLLSGNPVSFRQAIYEAYYVTRPEVPVEVAGRILPLPDQGTLAQAQSEAMREEGENDKNETVERAKKADGFRRKQPAAKAEAPAMPPPAPEPAHAVNTAQAQEAMTQVAFRIPVPVTVAQGRSAIVPIVDRAIPAERIALVETETSANHPLAALKRVNDGASGLPPGVVTIYEVTPFGAAYLGDARLPSLPAGENRMLSYAVDEKTKVLREEDSATRLTRATFAQGVLQLTRTVRQTVTYRVAAPPAEPRRVVIEEEKVEEAQIVEPPEKALERTPTGYRYALSLKPGEARSVRFVQESPELESVSIADTDDDKLAALVAGVTLDPKTKTAFAELARLRRALAERRQALAQIGEEFITLTSDQARVRDSLGSVERESALHKRYMEKLAQQENDIEKLQASRAKATEAARAAEAALGGFMARLGR